MSLSTVIKSFLLLVALLWRSSCSSYAGVSFVWNVAERDPLCALIAGFDDLWRYNKFFLNNKEACIILVCTAVVCTRSDRNALSACKPVDAIGTDLVGTNQNLQLVHFEELFYCICAK